MQKTTTIQITIIGSLAVMALAIACTRNPQAPQATEATATPAVKVNCADAEKPMTIPPIPNTIDSTCAKIPADINGTGDTQPGPDLYSWLAFVAVNWPVDPTTCTGNASASILN